MVDLDLEKPENEKLLANLYAYSRGLYNRFYNTEVNHEGKSFKDYVHDAIEKHLRGKDKFDASRGTLNFHLKMNVIRRDIVNDLPLEVRKAYQKRKEATPEEEEMIHIIQEVQAYIDPEDLPSVDFALESFDNARIFKAIEDEINDDVVERIYLAVVQDKYQFNEREEICTEYDMSTADFDNGKRRLLTIVRRVFKKFDII